MTPSRFLKEAQAVLNPSIKQETRTTPTYSAPIRYNDSDDDYRTTGGYTSAYAKKTITGTKPQENKGVQYASYKSGTRIRHPKFGEGIVIAVKGQGDNTIIDVAFKGVGVKQLSLKYAPVEIING